MEDKSFLPLTVKNTVKETTHEQPVQMEPFLLPIHLTIFFLNRHLQPYFTNGFQASKINRWENGRKLVSASC